jgi:hypothetical protein
MAPPAPGPALWGLAAAALALALPATVYKGAVFSVTAQPGWRDARWTAGALSASSVLLGVAMLALQARLLKLPAAGLLGRAAPPLLVLEAALFAAWTAGARRALGERVPADRRVAGGLFQWGARAAALALVVLGAPTVTATAALALLVAVPGYVARRDFLGLPHRPRLAGPPAAASGEGR